MTLPVWGCPWHGLVHGGQLDLPNGEALIMPTGYAASSGDTYLVKAPWALPIERTTGEQAADTESGRQWWDRAILSGQSQMLHGVDLDGYIYCDPEGSAWRVTGAARLYYPDTSTQLTVTISRFGVLGGPVESYQHTIIFPDLGQSTPEIYYITQLRFALADTLPGGSRALLSVTADRSELDYWVGPGGAGLDSHYLRWPSGTRNARWKPAIGWLELSISGAGDAAAVSLSVLKTRADAIGAREIAAPPPTLRYWSVTSTATIESETFDEQGNLTQRVTRYDPSAQISDTSPGGVYALIADDGGDSSVINARRGICLAAWYTAAAAIEWVTMDLEVEQFDAIQAITFTAAPGYSYEPAESGAEVAETWSAEQGYQSWREYRYIIRVGGIERDRAVVRYTVNGNAWLSKTGSDTWSQGHFRNGSPVPGLEVEGTVLSVPSTHWHYPHYFDPRTDRALRDNLFALIDQPGWGDRPIYGQTDARLLACPHVHSNHVAALISSEASSGVITWTFSPAIAPSGSAVSQAITYQSTTSRLYGSWCPVTGQVARSTSPVCWT